MSTYLTLSEVENELRDVTAADWFQLGVQLGVKAAKLKEIEKDHPRDVQRCKIEALDLWLRNTPDASWGKLADVLHKTGGDDALVQRLKRKISPKENLDLSVTPALSVDGATNSHDTSQQSLVACSGQKFGRENVYSKVKADPPLSEQLQGLEVNEDELMVGTHDIRSEFNVLFTIVRRSLMSQGVTVRDFVLFLKNVPGYAKKSLLDTELSNLCESSDLIEVFETVGECCSWFNHSFLGEIVDAYCRNEKEIKMAYQEFCSHLRRYCKLRVKSFPFKNGFGVKRKKGCTQMILKVDKEWEYIRIEQLEEVIFNLACILKVSRPTLHLCSVENGCVQLMLIVPSYIPSEVLPLTAEQKEALMEVGVTDLQCGSYHFSQQMLPLTFPGLEEGKSIKEGTLYQSRVFQPSPQQRPYGALPFSGGACATIQRPQTSVIPQTLQHSANPLHTGSQHTPSVGDPHSPHPASSVQSSILQPSHHQGQFTGGKPPGHYRGVLNHYAQTGVIQSFDYHDKEQCDNASMQMSFQSSVSVTLLNDQRTVVGSSQTAFPQKQKAREEAARNAVHQIKLLQSNRTHLQPGLGLPLCKLLEFRINEVVNGGIFTGSATPNYTESIMSEDARIQLNHFCQTNSVHPQFSFIEDASSGQRRYKCTITYRINGRPGRIDSPGYYASKGEAKEKAARILIEKETQVDVNAISSRGHSPTAKIWKSKLKEYYDKSSRAGVQPDYVTKECPKDGYQCTLFSPEIGYIRGDIGRSKSEAEHSTAYKALQKLKQL